MKRLVKINEEKDGFALPTEAFGEGTRVQGGVKRALGNAIRVESGGRYKLFTDGCDYIKIHAGDGFFKWARGETPFRGGEIFLAEAPGEYEVNGVCVFTVVRE
ncbi:MAG: hypothetical protein ACI4NG_05305 [Candidatus Gallimonas sp.]